MSTERRIIKDEQGDYYLNASMGIFGEKRLKMHLRVCDNPKCSTPLHIALIDEADKQKVIHELNPDIPLRNLGEDALSQNIQASLTKDDWTTLDQLLDDVKFNMEIKNRKKEVRDFSMSSEIEQNGELVYYNEILPYEDKYFIEVSAGLIIIEDAYCLRSGCHCDRSLLSFHYFQDTKQVSSEEHVIELHYKKRQISNIHEGKGFTQSAKEIFELLKTKHPDLFKQMERRHKELVKLYAKYRKTHTPVLTAKKSEDVGRNDLCPCGSGKKYKKCCL